MLQQVVIVGASLAGLRAAESLRAEGYEGELTVVGDEPHAPYNRPPLSKEFLAGTMARDAVALEYGEDLGVQWLLGVAAAGLDLTRRRVRLADGSELAFDGLVIATGVRPRVLRDAPRGGVFTLRTLDDAVRLREAIEQTDRVVIVGTGFIGCEVASTAQSMGREVIAISADDVPLRASLGPKVGAWLAELHRSHGVMLELDCPIAAFEGGDNVEAVRLADGRRIDANLVVLGLGSVPCTEWLEGSGIPLEDGVLCEMTLAVSGLENVVAAGDIVRRPYSPGAAPMRIEHWSNAVEQGLAAARTLLQGQAAEVPPATLPSFWSDQYGLRIQSIGWPALAPDSATVLTGSFEGNRFLAAYTHGGRLVGAVSAGLPPRHLARMRAAVLRDGPLGEVVTSTAE